MLASVKITPHKTLHSSLVSSSYANYVQMKWSGFLFTFFFSYYLLNVSRQPLATIRNLQIKQIAY